MFSYHPGGRTLAGAFDGMDVVYYLVHSMGTSKNFVAEEAESARNVVGAARAAGVRRVVTWVACTRTARSSRGTWHRMLQSATSSSTRASRPWCYRPAS